MADQNCGGSQLVLIDELVAYVRQFSEGQSLSGGTYDSNLSFIQSLTEAAKLVPTAIVLASLPESDVEAGSQRGVAALRALEKTFGRIQALWKPVATEEAFEIVRRRLFEAVHEMKARDAVCRTFADAYIATIRQGYARARQELGGVVGENETVKTVDAACQADWQWPRHLRTRALPLSARPSHEWSRWTRTMCALR
jgi:hypothetical protein